MSSDDEIELSRRMNQCVVPEFEIDDNDYYPSISSPTFTPSKKSTIRGDEEMMELVWQNGQIIVQSQSQNRKFMKKSDLFVEQSSAVEEEDEMNSLLQSPVDDSAFLYTTPTTSAVLPAGEIDATTRSCTAVSTAALAGEIDSTAALPAEVDKIGTSAVEIRPAKPYVETTESSSSQLIIPQLKCIEGELTDQLQNYLYTRQNCAAAAPAEEIDTSSVRTIASSSSPWPITQQLRSTEGESICHFSRLPEEPILRNCSVKPSTVVESNDTVIAAVPEYTVPRVSDNVTPVSSSAAAAAEAAGGVREVMRQCELTLTSSTSGSAGSVSACAEPLHPSWKEAGAAVTVTAAAETDRKRKNRESDDNEDQSEDVEFECADAKKQVRSSTSAKKSRAAKVHNLSERKRRERINEKMRTLQELIPRCNKTDKVSMLDEAIEYLRSLQLQVQMMSSGCNMVVPMVYPGIPQYMPTMGMNIGMAMNRPMVPYPPLMPGPAMQNPAVAAQMAPQYPLPACHLPSRIPAVNQPYPPRLNSQNFSDPYHQYFDLQQAQLMLPQSQRAEQPSSSEPNSCVEGSAGNHQSG